jgi:hypothetical protein
MSGTYILGDGWHASTPKTAAVMTGGSRVDTYVEDLLLRGLAFYQAVQMKQKNLLKQIPVHSEVHFAHIAGCGIL